MNSNNPKETKVYKYDINSAYLSIYTRLHSYVSSKGSKSDKQDGIYK
jgi:hypothetical protein